MKELIEHWNLVIAEIALKYNNKKHSAIVTVYRNFKPIVTRKNKLKKVDWLLTD